MITEATIHTEQTEDRIKLLPMKISSTAFLIVVLSLVLALSSHSRSYLWLDKYEESRTVANRIQLPEGYERTETHAGTFADWLRYLPLKGMGSVVYLYDGREKTNQDAHFAVADMDVGDRDLQQCADAVIRLRAEYLYSLGSYERIHFNFTSGDRADFTEWADGYRPIGEGNKVRWTRSEAEDSSYPSFRKYLERVFMYAGSHSLSRELHGVQDVNEMKAGNVFIQGGFPGHAAIVVDMAINRETGEKLFLLAQSYMPAQDIHILKNPVDTGSSPWYKLDFGETLCTPEWTFSKSDLRRF